MAWSTVPSPTTGTVITTTGFGTPVANNMGILAGSWSAYTPTLTGITLGNGTRSFAFLQFGKTILARGQFQAGSTTTYSATTLAMTLPVTPHANITSVGGYAIGSAVVQPGGPATRCGCTVVVTTTGTINFLIDNGSANTLATNLIPSTFGTSGMISLNVMYEAA